MTVILGEIKKENKRKKPLNYYLKREKNIFFGGAGPPAPHPLVSRDPPALITADHVPIVVEEAADAACDAVLYHLLLLAHHRHLLLLLHFHTPIDLRHRACRGRWLGWCRGQGWRCPIVMVLSTQGCETLNLYYYYYYCIDRCIYLKLSKSTQSAVGLKDLKPAANGRYLISS